MAKKRVEITLQEEIETQEEWENILQREGLIIIDVYQDWSGPCKAVVGLFRRLKTELNDDLLHFAVAKSDSIEALEKYRGKCEPCFLFFGGGCLVAAVRGVNPPELEKNIVEKLKQEHEVMKGETERVEIKDPVLLAQELAELEERRRKEEEEEIPQEVTVVILKPDIVSSDKADKIIEEFEDNGVSIIERREHELTVEEAEKYYEKHKDESYFNNLVDFMTSGPIELLICAKGAEGVIEDLRALVGPAISVGTPALPAKEEAEKVQLCLKTKYGIDTLRNAVHAADSKDEVERELALFFPDFEPPTVVVRRKRVVADNMETSSMPDRTVRSSQYVGFGPAPPGMERTVAILRPKAYELYKEVILEKIKEAGFLVAIQKEIQLTREQAEEYYSEHQGDTYFEELTTVMSSGPLLALLLARQDAVGTWREMLGPDDVQVARSEAPESLRAQFVSEDVGIEEEVEGEKQIRLINLIHGSSTLDEVERDMGFFFPVERTVAVVKPDAYANRDEIIERIKAAGFHVVARKDMQLTEEMARQLYEDSQDKPFFEDLVHHMISGRTLFMVLTRQDAIAGWRNLMGPTDPDKAAEETPENTDPNKMSIRAIYGRSVVENAVHGSSNAEHAAKTIELIFGNPNIGCQGYDEPQPEAEEAQATEEAGEIEETKSAEGEEVAGEAGSSPPPEDGAEATAAEEETGAVAAPESADQLAEELEEAQIGESAEGEARPEEESKPEDQPAPEAEAPDEAPAEPTEETAAPEDNPPDQPPEDQPPTDQSPTEEVPAEGEPEAVEENQNQSANSNIRTSSGFSSTSSSASVRRMKTRSGDSTPKPKSALSKDSSDTDKVLSCNSVDTASCQCNPYFRTGKRRKSNTNKSTTRKRVNLDVDPTEHKQYKLMSLIRKRPFSTQ